MFDKLVESTREKKNGRAGRIFFLTGLVYVMLLGTVAIMTILGLNPSLAESYEAIAMVPPPPPGERVPELVKQQLTPPISTQAPNSLPNRIIDVATPQIIDQNIRVKVSQVCLGCVVGGSGPSLPGGVIGGKEDAEAPPPPPAPKPRPTPDPTPEPKPVPKIVKVSSISPGSVLRRVTPQYSAIAKATHAAGAVQVQVLISEEGQVLSAEAVSGNPILRPLAIEAARQWLFKPTMLNDVPVKVQGILTFNFTLN